MPDPKTSQEQSTDLESQARNMHEDVEADEDQPCICSPEPRWQALAEEMERERQARERQG